MKDLTLDDVASFHAWAYMLIHNEESYMFPEINLQLDLYGADDSAYLVMDIYPDEKTTLQYVVAAASEADEPKQLLLIFEFLKTFNYSLRDFLAWLEGAPFVDTEMGDRLEINGLFIARSWPQPKGD
jgi:hypothetical protein